RQSMANQRHHEQHRRTPTLAPEGVHLDARDAFFRKSDSAGLEQVMRENLIEFTAQVERYNTPASVLDALDDAIAEDVSLMVLGAKRFAMNLNDRENLKVGENVFIHKSVPDGWWDAYFDLSKKAYAPIIMMARHCMAPFTWTECLRMFEPVGIDRWAHELGLKHGMRDGLTCPAGARWVVVY